MEFFGGYSGGQPSLTPPRGRLGHSLPTPRVLGEGPIFVSSFNEEKQPDTDAWQKDSLKKPKELKIDLPLENTSWHNQNYKPPSSPLNQIRPPLFDVKILETFKEELEESEDRNDSIVALTDRLVISHTEDLEKDELERFKGNSLLSVSYKPSQQSPLPTGGDELGGSFVSAFAHSLNSSFNLPFVTSPTKDRDSFLFPTVARNPNKALVTIDAKSSLILVANEVTCNLFGYQKCDLVGLKIQHLFTQPYQSRQRALVEENIDSTGETVLISGKVMEAITSYGLVFPVSVWMKKFVSSTPDPRVIIVIEPVARTSLYFSIDEDANIVCCDPSFATLFGYDTDYDVIGNPISSLVPSIIKPHPSTDEQFLADQSLTGHTKDGSVFPLEVVFTGTSMEPDDSTQEDKLNKTDVSCDDRSCDCTSGDCKSCDHKSHNSGTDCSNEGTTISYNVDGCDVARVYTHGKVVVYASLSGMVCFNSDGAIEGCNHHFALMLFGCSQKELLKKDITFIMPNFYSHLTDIEEHEEDDNERNIPVHPLFEQEVENGLGIIQDPTIEQRRVSSKEDLFYSVSERSVSLEYGLETHLTSISEESDVFLSDNHKSYSSSPGLKCDSSLLLMKDSSSCEYSLESNSAERISGGEDQELLIQFLPHVVNIGDRSYEYSSGSLTPESEVCITVENIEDDAALLNTGVKEEGPCHEPHDDRPKLSSTPCRVLCRPNSRHSLVTSRTTGYPEGTYMGKIKHKDGSLMSVVFELKHITLRNDSHLYCMWITRDFDCLVNDNSNTIDSLQRSQQRTPDAMMNSSGLTGPQEEAMATEGKYFEAYETLGPIGRGAFGFVKLAKRREDSLLVVVKFIKKATVITENWVDNETMGLVPREICLLAHLNHPNIVQLLEAYENEQYFQLVMEKHGNGMDMFSFIENDPDLDELLISYLFRQLVSGLSYLHQSSILHRDVKDENIILDNNFHVKIIDFGSAVLMGEGILFNTFCGTLEYCSPEVLLGNSYAGPELEMWSLGITLYTIVYNENPFFDVEEIISGRLQPPYLVSPGLMKIILWLLHPDPVSRATLHDLEHNKWVNQEIDISLYSFETVLEGSKNKDQYNTTLYETKPKQKCFINRTLS